SGDAIGMDYYSGLGPIDPQVQRPGGGMVPALGYLLQYDRLIQKAQKGKLTSAEITYLVANFNPAELYRYEQARDHSIALLKEWLVKYKFKNWTRTETKGRRVTPAMRVKRAEQCARILQDTARWNSHGRGISMEVLRRDVNLKVDDFAQDPDLRDRIRPYYRLVKDFMARLGVSSVVHSHDFFTPLSR
ncbi:MAG: serine dehydrogenasease, partial [Vicinamibacterales bacterium]